MGAVVLKSSSLFSGSAVVQNNVWMQILHGFLTHVAQLAPF
jgi:hypothetical protein